MHGQSVAKYIAPLTAGLQAVYTAALPAPPAFWRHSDWLGTVHLDSTPAQTVYFDGGWAPFGETYAGMGTSDRSFTGQTQDTGVGLYDFLFRQYSPTQGRWLVPDPAGLAAVDITNPQTWNRYAYVANNPLNAIDPLGLYLCGTHESDPWCNGADDIGGGGDGGGNGADSGGNGNPNAGVNCGYICNFFSGMYTGVFTSTQVDTWQTQYLFQHSCDDPCTQPSNFLPQNQNPRAQAANWLSSYVTQISQSTPVPVGLGIASSSQYTQSSSSVSGNSLGLAQQNAFYIPSSPVTGGAPACQKTFDSQVKRCESQYSGQQQQVCLVNASQGFAECVTKY